MISCVRRKTQVESHDWYFHPTRIFQQLLISESTNSISQDDTRDPLQYGYQRVNTGEGSLSTSTTGTSLDTIVLDTNAEDLNSTPRVGAQRTFSPILETDDTNPFLDPPVQKSSTTTESKAKSKSSLKGSRVSFDQEDRFDESDEGFRKQREHFQKNKSHSTSEHKNQLIKVSWSGGLS